MKRDIQSTIKINADIQATLKGMDDVVSKLNKGLREAETKIDLTKGIGSSISKYIEKYKEESSRFAQLTSGNKVEFGDYQDAIKSGTQMLKTFKELKRIVGDFNDLTVFEAKKLFPDAFNNEVEELRKKLSGFQDILNRIEVKEVEITNAENALNRLNHDAELLKIKLAEANTIEIEAQQAQEELKKANEEVERLHENLKKKVSLQWDDAKTNVSNLTAQKQKREEEILAARIARGVKTEDFSGSGNNITYKGKTKTGWKEDKNATAEQKAAARAAIDLYRAEQQELEELRIELSKAEDAANKFQKTYSKISSSSFSKVYSEYADTADEIDEGAKALKAQEQAANNAKVASEKLLKSQKETKNTREEFEKTTKAIEKQEAEIKELKTQKEGLEKKLGAEDMSKAFGKLNINFSQDMLKNADSVRLLKEELDKIDDTDLSTLKTTLLDMGFKSEQVEEAIEGIRRALDTVDDGADGIKRSAQEIENLKNQVLQFFTISNSVQLFKRAVTKALNTVRELDKTMTEAAVVTEFDVGDMWDKLPQYTKEAQKLGVSINGMYQATTLYYQQGLKTNEAMALGVETMKMAKIAGIDSTEATKAMTSALRGFNMELNETSATRVNDVYSQLAAVTAADTAQIATAMEKTASIAAAANMEFETTAAFLAQIIETTQEAPETAGTALKTIIARFSEVKSLREQGLSSGQDEEGEGIDVNKIQTALKSVGISMEGFFAGTEGLDSILLKLAEKWKDLDFETQRYIATMAAGSRQQSRFIAMMSDYSRTAELVGEAQNSAGASQEQFNKTLDSMESKLQKLENAWNEFLMGLANNEILKGAVDLLTSLVTGINNMTNALSGGSGLVKSIFSLMTVIGGLNIGKSALGGALNWAGKKMGMISEDAKQAEQSAFSHAIEAKGQGKNGLVAFFTSEKAKEKASKRKADARIINAQQKRKKALKQAKSKEEWEGLLPSDQNGQPTEAQNKAIEVYNKTLNEVGNTQEGARKAAEAATKEYQKQGGQLLSLSEKQEIASKSTAKFGINFKAVGGAIAGVGGALGALAALFSALGLDEEAETVGIVAGAVVALGSIVSTLGPIFQNVGGQIAAAGQTAQAGWGWIGLILAAVAALITVIIVLVGQSKTATERMAKLDSQMAELAESAKKAEEAMVHLGDTQEKLVELQNTMKGLVKGTDDWRKSLIESNNQVLELLNTYPELSDFIERSEDGLLSIKTEGWNIIIGKQLEAFSSSSAAQLALSIEKTMTEYEEITRAPLEEYENEKVRQAKLDSAKFSGDLKTKTFYDQILASDITLGESKEAKAAAQLLAEEGLTGFTDAWINELNLIAKRKNSAGGEEAIKKYASMMGLTLEEAEAVDYELVRRTVAAKQLADKRANQIREIGKALKKNDNILLTKLFLNDGASLTKTDFDSLKKSIYGQNVPTDNIEMQQGLNSYLREQGVELEGAQLQGVLDIIKNLESFYNGDNEISTLAGDIALDQSLKEFLDNQQYGIVYNFYSKIKGLTDNGVKQEEVSGFFNNFYKEVDKNENLTEDQRTYLWEQLSITDWSSIEDIDSTFSILSEMLGGSNETLLLLQDRMIELTDAVSDNTIAQMQTDGYKIKEVLQKILSGEILEIMTTDQKTALEGNVYDPADFVPVGKDQWVYVGGNLYDKAKNYYEELSGRMEPTNTVRDQKYSTALDLADKVYDNYFTTLIAGPGFKTFTEANLWAENRGNSKYKTFNEWLTDKDINPTTLTGPDKEGYQVRYLDYLNEMVKGDNSYVTAEMSGLEIIEILQAGGWVGRGNDENGNAVGGAQSLGEAMAEVLGAVFPEPVTDEKGNVIDPKIEERRVWILDHYNEYITKLEELQLDATNDAASSGLGVAGYLGSTAEYGYQAYENEELQKTYAENYLKGIEGRYVYHGGRAFFDKISEGVKTEQLAKYDTLIKALASDMGYTAKSVKTFAENMGQLNENLVSSKRGTVEYGEALNNAYNNIAAMFGKNTKWVEGLNLSDELIERLVQGEESAFEELTKKIQESAQKGIDGVNWGSFIESAEVLTKLNDINAIVNLKPGENNEAYNEYLKFFQDLSKDGRKEFTWMAALNGVTISFDFNEKGQVEGFLAREQDLSGLFTNYFNRSGGGSRYENPYDKLHNTLEEINDLLRERERLERRYQHLIDRGTKSVTDVQNARQAQLKNLEQENALQEEIIAGRNQQIDELLAKNSKMQKYVQTEDLGNGERSIRIDWVAIEKVRSSSTGEKIDEFYDKLKEYLESIYDAEKTITDNQDEQYDLLQEGKDEYFDLEDQVKEAIIEGYQKQIDELSNINDSVNDTNSRLLEAMQERLDEYRQNRDNERTEEEIADKQRRLAYLSQDTSGANATEVLALQKEINEAQEDYTDTLIDQKISELQKQNDLAAEQRQRQIEIAQAQLDHYEKTGGVWEEVDKLLSGAIGPNGEVLIDSKLMELLKEANNYTGLSEIGQMKWLSGIETMISQAFGWRDGKGVLSTFWNGKDIEFTTADGQVVKGKVGEDGKVTAEDGSVYENVQWLGGNQFGTNEKFIPREEKTEVEEEGNKEEEPKKKTVKKPIYKTVWTYRNTEYDVKEDAIKAVKDDYAQLIAEDRNNPGMYGEEDREEFLDYYRHPEKKINAKNKIIGYKTVPYKTGGLADFTGPAWLDGTKSKPEYILNADQTKAFFNLVDVLGSLQTKPSQTTEKSGDNTYDIDINVESIGSDYDVEQLAETVKRLINNDARYRNNNAINLMR